jgi:hypothetical protein
VQLRFERGDALAKLRVLAAQRRNFGAVALPDS